MAVRTLTVQVDEVLNGDIDGQGTITVENGAYEWGEPGRQPTSAAIRYTAAGQPWLDPGDRTLLILKKIPPERMSSATAEYHSFGAAGTYRVEDGVVVSSPRTPTVLSASELASAIVGKTPAEVDAIL